MRATPIPPPAKPTGFNAAAGDAEVTLTWTDPEDSTITSWQYQIDPGSWKPITPSGATTTSHTVKGLTNGTEYAFKIRAVNPRGPGEASDERKATPIPPPAKPTGLSATPGTQNVTLAWSDLTDPSVTEWQYQQNDGPGFGAWQEIRPSDASTTTHTVSGLLHTTEYAFKVRAVNLSGAGVPSDEARATPLPPTPTTASRPRARITTVSITSDAGADETYENGDIIEFTAQFSRSVRVIGLVQLAFEMGSETRQAAYTTGSSSSQLVFSYEVSDQDLDEDGIAIPAGSLELVAGATVLTVRGGRPATRTHRGLATAPAHKVDGRRVPVVTRLEVSSDPGADLIYTEGNLIELRVTFSDPVEVTGNPSIDLAVGDAARTAFYASGSGTRELLFSYQVLRQDRDDDGISVPAGQLEISAVSALTGLGGKAADTFHQGLSTQPNHRVNGTQDLVAPKVSAFEITSDPGADRTYTVGDVIRIAATFTEPVSVTGAPQLHLAVGNFLRAASYLSGSGTAELSFAYEVLEDDRDDDGVSMPAGDLAVPSGSAVNDLGGNNVQPAHTGLADQAGHTVDGMQDLVAPEVTGFEITSDPGADRTYTVGDVIRIAATFTEPVSVTGAPQLQLTIGNTRRTASYRLGSNTAELSFAYEVLADDKDDDGVAIPAVNLGLPAGAVVEDFSGNAARTGHAGLADQPDHTVDGMQDLVAPEVTAVEVDSNPGRGGIYRTDEEIRLLLRFSEEVTVTGTPQLELTIGAVARAAAYVSGSGTAALVFGYTVERGDRDDDGISAEADRLSTPAGAAIADEAGNAAQLSYPSLPTQDRHRVNLPTVSEAEKAILTKTLGVIAGNVLASVTNNIGTRFASMDSGSAAPTLTLAGRTIDLRESGDAAAGLLQSRGYGRKQLRGDDLLRGSAFVLPFGPGGRNGEAPAWTAWGLGDMGIFKGEAENDSRFSGSLRSAFAGIDARIGRSMVAGVAVSRSMSDAEYSFGTDRWPNGAGGLGTWLTSVHPYVRGKTGDGGEVWAVLGYGRGSAENSPRERAKETSDLGMMMAVVGTRQKLGAAWGSGSGSHGGRGLRPTDDGDRGAGAGRSRGRRQASAGRRRSFAHGGHRRRRGERHPVRVGIGAQ